MVRHFDREITALKKRVLNVGALADEMLLDAVRAVEERDAERARSVIARDAAVDAFEIETEEECLKILALHQPVALDLRFVTAVLKINNDFERMADQAVNIAERALRMIGRPPATVNVGYRQMADRTLEMVRRAVDALVKLDRDAAIEVCRADAEVDELYRSLCGQIEAHLVQNPKDVPAGLDMIAVLKNLERCADLATNIAEDVAYTVDGHIIRHPSLARRSGPQAGTP